MPFVDFVIFYDLKKINILYAFTHLNELFLYIYILNKW